MQHVARVLGLDSGLYPTKTDLPPAPDNLLKVLGVIAVLTAAAPAAFAKNTCSLACGQWQISQLQSLLPDMPMDKL